SVRRLQARLSAAEPEKKERSLEWLAAEFDRRGPWYSQFYIDGRPYGGERFYPPDARLKMFFDHVKTRQRILELGALEGGHSFELAKAPGVSNVIAVEGRAANIEKARFVQSLNGIRNVTFVEGDLRTLDLWRFSHVDAIFCSGVLYHLPEPWKLIEQCARLAPALFLCTHYCQDDAALETVNGYQVRRFEEGDLNDPLSGLQQQSVWLTLGGLMSLLMNSGYQEVRLLDLKQTSGGLAACLVALRS
ncbi:MAG: class I SAM-dependent methyltransferase, partial [Blastocatellia bacterium]